MALPGISSSALYINDEPTPFGRATNSFIRRRTSRVESRPNFNKFIASNKSTIVHTIAGETTEFDPFGLRVDQIKQRKNIIRISLENPLTNFQFDKTESPPQTEFSKRMKSSDHPLMRFSLICGENVANLLN